MPWKLEESKSFLAQTNGNELNGKSVVVTVEDADKVEETVGTKMPPVQQHLTDNQRVAVRLRMVLNFAMMILFALCTLLQYNDPDPAMWMPVYIVPCLLCMTDLLSSRFFATVMHSLLRPIHLLFCLGVLIASVVLFAMNFHKSNFSELMEYFREFSGLVVVFGWYLTASMLINEQISSQLKLECGCAFAVLIIVLMATAWACFAMPDGHGPDHLRPRVLKANVSSFSLHNVNRSLVWPF